MPTASNDNQSRLPTDGSRLRQIGFIPLLAIFYGYTAGGPFGFENIYRDAGPGMALVFLTFVPFFWSIPISFAAAELNSILPVQGGFYRWTRAAFGDFWGFQCGWWNWAGTFLLNSLYGVLVMDYLSIYIPSITGPTKWGGACAVLIILAALNARGIQVAGWVSVALLVAVLIPVAWLCAVSLFHLHHNPVVPFVPPGARSAASSGAASPSPCGTTPATSSSPAAPARCGTRRRLSSVSSSGTRRGTSPPPSPPPPPPSPSSATGLNGRPTTSSPPRASSAAPPSARRCSSPP